MSVSAYVMVEGGTVEELAVNVAAKIATAYQPYGYPFARGDKMVQAMVQGTPVLNQNEDVSAIEDDNATNAANITTLQGQVAALQTLTDHVAHGNLALDTRVTALETP